MKAKFKKIFTNVRVIIFLVVLLFAVLAIHPDPTSKGVTIRSVVSNSSASIAGIQGSGATTRPMSRERIVMLNNMAVNNVADYYNFISKLKPNASVQLKTNKGSYKLTAKEGFDVIELDEKINQTITELIEFNETEDGKAITKNKTITKTIEVPKTKSVSKGVDLGMYVYDAPQTNLKKGLDLQGGTRVLLQPENKLSSEDSDTLMTNMKERLNVFGLSDIVVRGAGDLSGNQYILVEIAGATEEEIKNLLSKQGKFEAKIGNQTVFVGGKDITYVCRSPDCSGIDAYRGGCGKSNGQVVCRFRFSISLTQDAAQRQADITRGLDVIKSEGGESYLSEKLLLYLDDKQVDELNIGSDLKGKPATDIQISGSGVGATNQDAVYNAMSNMKRLQTILITGQLPVKLTVVKMDTISPSVGSEFIRNAVMIGFVALAAVLIVIFIRYRQWKIIIPMGLTLISEIIILLGVASLIGWNLDLAAIAGIIIAVGTGVDHLIVITDETLKGELKAIYDWKQRIKNAFYIILAAFFINTFALIPLIWAGGGLFRGFAITTIIGFLLGVFISRPVYARIIEIVLKDN